MKKIGWSTLIALLMIISVNAQEIVRETKKEDNVPKNIIKIHPLAALSGVIGVELR